MRKNCIVCGAKLHNKPLIVLRNMPNGARNMPLKDEIQNDTGIDLELCQRTGCGLVQFNCDPLSYSRDSTRAGDN